VSQISRPTSQSRDICAVCTAAWSARFKKIASDADNLFAGAPTEEKHSMPKFVRSRKFVIATAVVGVGALGVGVAGAVGGLGATPGPSANAGAHPAPEATGSSLPPAASAGSGNAASVPVTTTLAPETPAAAPESTGTPGVGEAPASIPDTALNATEGTFGNTVLNILGTTAPGPERGAAISEAAHDKPGPTLPDQANSHKP
jgi:hypothetical protein